MTEATAPPAPSPEAASTSPSHAPTGPAGPAEASAPGANPPEAQAPPFTPRGVPLVPTVGTVGSALESPAIEVAPGVFELRVQDTISGPAQRLTEALQGLTPAEVPAAAKATLEQACAPLQLDPKAWAQRLETPDWLFAAARARHLADPSHPARTGWLPNGTMTEAAYRDAIKATENGSLR